MRATKEEQAKICWNQVKMFIQSLVANPRLRKHGFCMLSEGNEVSPYAIGHYIFLEILELKMVLILIRVLLMNITRIAR